MAEIKLNDGFAAEVNALRASGNQLDQVSVRSVSAGGLSTSTVEAYQERLSKIRTLMLEFQLLTQRDAEDLDALADSLRATDKSSGVGGR